MCTEEIASRLIRKDKDDYVLYNVLFDFHLKITYMWSFLFL